MRFALGSRSIEAFHLAILERQDWFQTEGRTDKALCAADSSTAVQKFQSIHCEIHTGVIPGFFCKFETISETGATFGGAGYSQHLKTKGHRRRETIHDIYFLAGGAH